MRGSKRFLLTHILLSIMLTLACSAGAQTPVQHQTLLSYLQTTVGISLKPDDVTMVPAPTLVDEITPKGAGRDVLQPVIVPDNISANNVAAFIVSSQIGQPEKMQRKLSTILKKNPEAHNQLALAVKKYFALPNTVNTNPYLTERAIKGIVAGVDNADSAAVNKLAFMSDIYYLLAAMGEDVSGAQQLQFKHRSESYTVVHLNKKHLQSLSNIGVNLPLNYLDDYNETYERFVENGRSKEKNKGDFDTKTLAQFEGLSTKGKIMALDLFDVIHSQELNDRTKKRADRFVVRLPHSLDALQYSVDTGSIEITVAKFPDTMIGFYQRYIPNYEDALGKNPMGGILVLSQELYAKMQLKEKIAQEGLNTAQEGLNTAQERVQFEEQRRKDGLKLQKKLKALLGEDP